MYSVNLAEVTLTDFKRLLTDYPLIPSRQPLLDQIEERFSALSGIAGNLGELRKKLKKADMAEEIKRALLVDDDYIKLLLREINSYEVKNRGLDKLEILSPKEQTLFESNGIKKAKDIWSLLKTEGEREAAALRWHIPKERLRIIWRMINLLRINGIGNQFAAMLFEAGIDSPEKFMLTDAEQLLDQWKAYREKEKIKSDLGINDILWCKKYSSILV